jgi:hypothetical protein
LVALFVGGSWLFSPCQDPNYRQAATQSQKEQCTTTDGRIVVGADAAFALLGNNTADDWIAISTGLLVIVTAMLGWIAYQQFTTTRAQLRAHVFPTEVVIFAVSSDGTATTPFSEVKANYRFGAEIKIENLGETPAYDVITHTDVKLVQWPIVDSSLPPLERPREGSRDMLGPEQSRYLHDASSDPLTDADIIGLRNKTLAIVAYGIIWYRDVFRRHHTTRFRFFVGGRPGIRGTAASGHDHGNEAD